MKRASPRLQHATARRARVACILAFACFVPGSVAMSGLLAHAASPQASPAPSQAEIKAAFIFNFAKFTEWPPQAFAGANTPLSVGFLGADDVRDAFQALSAGKEINGRKVETRQVSAAEDGRACQVLFIGEVNPALEAGALKRARVSGALAVGESETFLAHGGMIRLLVESNRMRFDVNVGAVNRAKVRLSSKLLALARGVVDLPDPAAN
jgi:hypothetical protein